MSPGCPSAIEVPRQSSPFGALSPPDNGLPISGPAGAAPTLEPQEAYPSARSTASVGYVPPASARAALRHSSDANASSMILGRAMVRFQLYPRLSDLGTALR